MVFRTCLLLLFFACAHAQEAPQTPPEPTELAADWWEYLENPEELPEKIPLFRETLEGKLKELPEESQERANALINRTVSNLQALVQISQLPLPTIPTPPTLKQGYTVEEIIELNRNLRKVQIELQTEKADRKDQQNQITTAERHLQALVATYNLSKERSQEKLLLGLEVIAYQSAIELTKTRLTYLDRSIEVDQAILKHLQEELNFALGHIVSTPERKAAIEGKIIEATLLWDSSKKKLNEKEIEAAISVSGLADDVNEANDQYLTQQLIHAQIEETLVHNRVLLLQIEKALVDVVSTPDQVDVTELDEKLAKWEQTLESLNAQIAIWKTQTERQLRSTTQILSLIEQEERTVSPSLILLQQQLIRLSNENLTLLQRAQNEINDSTFLFKELENQITSLFAGPKRVFRESYLLILKTSHHATDWLWITLFQVGKTPVTVLTILRFLLILLITWWIARLIVKAFSSLRKRKRGISKAHAYRISRLFRYFIYAVGILIAFWSLGFDFSYFFLIAGALGVGLGFGLQSIFNNFISGIIILFESHLQVGDYIELEKEHLRGEIRAIDVRNITIRTNDGIDILVPNSEIIGTKIINWTLNDPFRRVHIPFNVAYGSDKDLIKKVVEEAAKEVEFTLNRPNTPPPQVRFTKFGESSLEFELSVWVNEKISRRSRATRSAYLWAVDNALREHDIKIPFPQRDIHIIEN